MNKNITNKLLELHIQGSLKLEKDFIPRDEKCPICKEHLIETFYQKSDKPTDRMRVGIGRIYNTWYVSDSIHCPKCKINFAHQPTNVEMINNYLSIVEEGAIYKLALAKDFDASQYDTPIKKNILKGAVFYASAKSVAAAKKGTLKIKPESTMPKKSGIVKMKEGFTKENSFKKVPLGEKNGFFEMRIPGSYKIVASLRCVSNPEDLFTDSNVLLLPASLFVFPKEN